MHNQGDLNAIVRYFRPSRKCFSFNGSFLFLLILIVVVVQQAAARSSYDEKLPHGVSTGAELKDVNNLEINDTKLTDNVLQENHPVIIYKEDFVSEDYVPMKNETKSEKHKRRYKDIINRRHHIKHHFTDVVIEEKPEKMLFDIIPEKPIIVQEDMDKYAKSNIKLVPLTDGIIETKESEIQENFSKGELKKVPKKFHGRVRRNANGEHIVRKRNPYFRYLPKVIGEIPIQVQYVYVKHSIPGKKYNGLDILVPGPTPTPTNAVNIKEPISFDNRIAVDENDRVIFFSGNSKPRTTKRPIESIFRDPRPENFDFSFMNKNRPATTTRRPATRRPQVEESIFRDPRPENFDFSFMNNNRPATTTAAPTTTRRPATRRPQLEESIFRDPRPENFDFSFMNKGQQQTSTARTTTTRAPQPVAEAGISTCVWAIVHCCSPRSSEIRYSCFEQNGCYGAFWGLNPCAENVRDNIVNYVADYYD